MLDRIMGAMLTNDIESEIQEDKNHKSAADVWCYFLWNHFLLHV